MTQRFGSYVWLGEMPRAKMSALLSGGEQQIRKRESLEILSQDLSGSCYHNYAHGYFFQMFLWSFSTYCILAS